LATVHPGRYGALLASDEARQDRARLGPAEEREFGITSVELTAAMLADWGLPDLYVETVRATALPAGIANVGPSSPQRLATLLGWAASLSQLIVACGAPSDERASVLATVAQESGLSADDLARLCDEAALAWKEWSQSLGIPARPGADPPMQRPQHSGGRPAAPAPPQPPADDDGLPVVLVAEDSDVQRKLLCKVLQSAGYAVLDAADGERALRLALEQQPDIVLADWQMPGLTGIELCAALRKTRYGQGVYFVLVTAANNEDILVEAFERGVAPRPGRGGGPAGTGSVAARRGRAGGSQPQAGVGHADRLSDRIA
jgi:CheY-like chemotaxis protein